MKLLMICSILFCSAVGAQAKPRTKVSKANATVHTIKAPGFKAHAKALAISISGFSLNMFDTVVIDPLGVALQGFADGLDMFIAAPLEALPEPLEAIGDGVHVVYTGIDKVGEVLAR